MMRVYFCRSQGPAAWLIRIGTMSHWNHVAIEIDGHIWHSTGSRGVHKVTLDHLLESYVSIDSIPISMPRPGDALAFLSKQQGKPYDWGAVFGMFFRAGWHDDDKWFCSELVAGAIEAGNRRMRLPSHRVTPRDLWVCI